MTKIKIAAVVMCMIATGAFAGFTYQAANHDKDNVERVTVRNVSDDEMVTNEEVTDEETTDDEVTAEEELTTEEETVIKTEAPVVTTAVKSAKADKKTETEKAKETTAVKTEKANDEVFNTLKKEMAAAPAVTTAVVTEAPEIVPETAAPAAEEAPVIEEVQSEPVYEEPAKTEAEQPAEEPVVTEAPAAPAEETQPVVSEEEPAEENNGRKIQVTDEEYIWLCNVVGHEYGSDWIAIEEKAKVVEAVMNRVNDPRFPNTIWGVLTQPYQFSGLEWTLYLGTYSYQVTDSVRAAVDLYLEHPEQFNHGYNSFWGDGSMNHFYAI